MVLKQDPNKQIVAWFKIAEFVSRGEKERALALYRLLAHAINDPAFAQQLEGDILLSFHDENAFDRYAQSAQLYLKDARKSEAAAVFEHLAALCPETVERLQLLCDLYKQFPKQQRIHDAMQHFLRLLISQKEFDRVSYVLQQLEPSDFGMIHQELVHAWVNEEDIPAESLRTHIRTIIDQYFEAKQDKALQTFLMMLQVVHENLYRDACLHLNQSNLNIN